jgi:hypothetical protein
MDGEVKMTQCNGNRKNLSESQARVVAQRRGIKTGIRYYPIYCHNCKAWHTTCESR